MEEELTTTEQLASQQVFYSKEQWHEVLDYVQAEMLQEQQVECPVTHTFTPGLYSREIFMPAQSLIMSKWHKTEHQFVILQGVVDVLDVESMTVERIFAPYTGITLAGTRRLLFTHEDTVWRTYHATDKTTPEEAEQDVIEPRDISLLINKAKEIL